LQSIACSGFIVKTGIQHQKLLRQHPHQSVVI